MIGTGIEEAINELDEEEDEQSFDEKERKQDEIDELHDDNVLGEIRYDEDEEMADEDERKQHMSLRSQRNSDASEETSLASLLMMNEIPQYENTGQEPESG